MTMTKQILKIETNGEILLFSENATQQIYPIKPKTIKRDLNSNAVLEKNILKYKCIIETTDSLNMKLLNQNCNFLIYSICKIIETGALKPSLNFVKDSLVNKDGYMEYCPILTVALVNFKYKSSSNSWVLEFEEV